MKTFSIRIDIDTIHGLRNGVPNILKTLKENEVKASFYCPMGWEGDLKTVINQRFIRTQKGLPEKDKIRQTTGKAGITGYAKIAKNLLKPKKFVEEKKHLEKIIEAGHELGVHGYIHAKWRSITADETREEFQYMTNTYEKLFGEKPTGFASPLFTENQKIRKLADQYNYEYTSLTHQAKPKKPEGFKHIEVPVNLDPLVNDTPLPIIYHLKNQGLEDFDIIEIIVKKTEHLENNVMHIHPKDEGIRYHKTFEKLIQAIKELNFEFKTLKQIAEIKK